MSISLRPTDAAEVVTTTVEGSRPAAIRADITLSVQVPVDPEVGLRSDGVPGPLSAAPAAPADHTVVADPDRLAQVLANLLENTLTYARGAVTVTLVQWLDDHAVITVTDDGPRIDPADLPRVSRRSTRPTAAPIASSAPGWAWPSRPSWWRPWVAT